MRRLALPALALSLLTTAAPAQDAKAPPADINAQFANPDVASFVKRFETESREVYAKREAITAALKIQPGTTVADVGAGTGIFTRLFADKVGAGGTVYAVDIAENFLKHIDAESKRLGQSQVKTVRGTQTETKLPEGAVDLVYVCDVYHHVEKPGPWLASIHKALKPAGRFALIEFDKARAKRGDFVKKHVRADKEVFIREVEAAGFRKVDLPGAPDLSENFFAVFEKAPGA